MKAKHLQENQKEVKTITVPVDELYEYQRHPYLIRDDEDMEQLMESIANNGLIYPIIVRENPYKGKLYEIISGHRRAHAFKRLGIMEIKAMILELSDDQADEMVVDTNCHREKILPSEKSRAYRLKLDAIKRQGKRTDLTSSQYGTKFNAAIEVGKIFQDSRNGVYRYLRLQYLIQEILNLVDEGRIALSPAENLSYLTENEQYTLFEAMELNDCTPSYSQSCNMKKESRRGTLDKEMIYKIMAEEKANQKLYIRFLYDEVRIYFPRDYTINQIKNVIWEYIKNYQNDLSTRNKDAHTFVTESKEL